ncbi:MAG: DUF4956 domain-containing protein [Clostridia bacterium]|nr:DUF4956 domain-containing protein [Clostridia bacterium]
MLDTLFQGLFSQGVASAVSVGDFLACVGTSLAIGLLLAFVYTYRTNYTKSFLVTLAIIPSVVCVVIMMVNGNIGAGVAVAGAFSLVRFRSQPGTAKEIVSIFLAMGAGLICGMGFLAYAVLFSVLLSAIMVLYSYLATLLDKKEKLDKALRVTIPEDLDYSSIFDDIFATYTTSHVLVKVKTSNMGSLYKLSYDITLKDAKREKEMLDAIRCRNGNLEVAISLRESATPDL